MADLHMRKEKLLDLRLDNNIDRDIYEKKNQELSDQLKKLGNSTVGCTMVWSYIRELVFNMLVLAGSVKMADRVVREIMGL